MEYSLRNWQDGSRGKISNTFLWKKNPQSVIQNFQRYKSIPHHVSTYHNYLRSDYLSQSKSVLLTERKSIICLL